ncbi:MAG: hypothetical protein PHD15_06890 [Clostridia bacterium]|nr:hypothetical protein [Clostridia bacterium]MDD4387455.1 hypothetical protein [Clostridia bacterium]
MNEDEIFDMFINEISGKKEIDIEGFVYNIALNYNITDTKYKQQKINIEDSLPIININNVNIFKEKLSEYIQAVSSKDNICGMMPFKEEKSKLKYIAAMLFVNATSEDFVFPIKYMDKYTAAIKDDTFSDLKEGISICKLNTFKDANLRVKSTQQSIFLETPQKLEFTLSKLMQDNNEYTVSLPSVSCFCYEDEGDKILNISAVQNKRVDSEKEKNIFEKQVNREKFKLNSGVEKEEQDVEPLSIISLAGAILLAKEKGINKVRMPDFMPMRWYAKSLANEKKSKAKNLNLEELKEEQIRIQTNVTDKLLRNMVRLKDQLGMLDISLIPGQCGDYFECCIIDKQVDNPNKILKEMADNICLLKTKQEDEFTK